MDINEYNNYFKREDIVSSEPQTQESDKKDKKGIADILSSLLSWVLVPLLMPVYGIMLIFHLSVLNMTSHDTKVAITLIVLGLNVALPMILVYLLKLFGFVQDVGLNDRKERFIPYIITLLCMGGTGLFVLHKGAPLWVGMFFIGGASAALVNFIVNYKWKISAHAAGIAGVVALLIRININGLPTGNVLPWLICAIILSGLLGSARVWLGRHTAWQIMAGYAVGFICVFFMTMI